MLYKSTRGDEHLKSSSEAIITGLACDRGLFVPLSIPKLPFTIAEGIKMNYQEVATKIINAFFDDFTETEIEDCVNKAYDEKFDDTRIVPVVKKGKGWFLELYHGKTAAFKDMALSILPYLLKASLKKEKVQDRILILTATSGDTGKAALEGFSGVSGTEIVVFYPEEGVSLIQKMQMVTQEGDNTHVFSVKGNFDDAQKGVKDIFNDEAFKEELKEKNIRLSSANSINIGRLVPQVSYYVYGYLHLVKEGAVKRGEKVNVVVPTGNFGNILAAYYASLMGIPVNMFICASNENKVLTDFLNTGSYDTRREFHVTNSPSMDILVSSNLERLLYLLSNEDGKTIRDLMERLDSEKHYRVDEKIRANLSKFYGGFCTEEETNKTIREMFLENNYLIDTHTAVAYKVYLDYLKETGDETPTLVASTASAYKFAESVALALGLPKEDDEYLYESAIFKMTGVKVPQGLKGLRDKKILHNKTLSISRMKEEVRRI